MFIILTRLVSVPSVFSFSSARTANSSGSSLSLGTRSVVPNSFIIKPYISFTAETVFFDFLKLFIRFSFLRFTDLINTNISAVSAITPSTAKAIFIRSE